MSSEHNYDPIEIKKQIEVYKAEIKSLRKTSGHVQQYCSGPALDDADGFDAEALKLEGKVKALEELLA